MKIFFSADYVHIYLIYCLDDEGPYFEHIHHYAFNISKEKNEKLRKYLFKTKEFNEHSWKRVHYLNKRG